MLINTRTWDHKRNNRGVFEKDFLMLKGTILNWAYDYKGEFSGTNLKFENKSVALFHVNRPVIVKEGKIHVVS